MEATDLEHATKVINMILKLLPSLNTSITNHIDTQNRSDGPISFQISLANINTSEFDFIETDDTMMLTPIPYPRPEYTRPNRPR